MKKPIQSIMIAATCIATTFTVLIGTMTMSDEAKAEDIASNISNISYISSYAEPAFKNNFENDKSALFQKFDLGGEEHEMNDAWLGMFVKSGDDTIVGTVAYAFLDTDGEISELLVELSASNLDYAVFVDGDLAQLTQLDVKIDLSVSQIANLEREQPNQFAQK